MARFKNPPISICNISEGKIKLSILDLKGFNVKRETCKHLIVCKPGGNQNINIGSSFNIYKQKAR